MWLTLSQSSGHGTARRCLLPRGARLPGLCAPFPQRSPGRTAHAGRRSRGTEHVGHPVRWEPSVSILSLSWGGVCGDAGSLSVPTERTGHTASHGVHRHPGEKVNWIRVSQTMRVNWKLSALPPAKQAAPRLQGRHLSCGQSVLQAALCSLNLLMSGPLHAAWERGAAACPGFQRPGLRSKASALLETH